MLTQHTETHDEKHGQVTGRVGGKQAATTVHENERCANTTQNSKREEETPSLQNSQPTGWLGGQLTDSFMEQMPNNDTQRQRTYQTIHGTGIDHAQHRMGTNGQQFIHISPHWSEQQTIHGRSINVNTCRFRANDSLRDIEQVKHTCRHQNNNSLKTQESKSSIHKQYQNDLKQEWESRSN